MNIFLLSPYSTTSWSSDSSVFVFQSLQRKCAFLCNLLHAISSPSCISQVRSSPDANKNVNVKLSNESRGFWVVSETKEKNSSTFELWKWAEWSGFSSSKLPSAFSRTSAGGGFASIAGKLAACNAGLRCILPNFGDVTEALLVSKLWTGTARLRVAIDRLSLWNVLFVTTGLVGVIGRVFLGVDCLLDWARSGCRTSVSKSEDRTSYF